MWGLDKKGRSGLLRACTARQWVPCWASVTDRNSVWAPWLARGQCAPGGTVPGTEKLPPHDSLGAGGPGDSGERKLPEGRAPRPTLYKEKRGPRTAADVWGDK